MDVGALKSGATALLLVAFWIPGSPTAARELGAAQPTQPTLELSPRSGGPGSETTVSGCGYERRVTLRWDGGDILADIPLRRVQDCFERSVMVPATATAGDHQIHASDSSGHRASSRFTVTATDLELRLAALDRLREGAAEPPKALLNNPYGTLLRGKTPLPAGDDVVSRVHSWLDGADALLGVEEGAGWWVLTNSAVRGRLQTLVFEQQFSGVPVQDSSLAVTVAGNHIISVNGQYLPAAFAPAPPSLQHTAALPIARSAARMPSGREGAPPALRIFNERLVFGTGSENTTLAWRILLGRDPEHPRAEHAVFIDAGTGAVLHSQSRARHVDKDWEVRDTQNDEPGCPAFDDDDPDWFDENGQLLGANPSAEGFATFSALRTVYDWYDKHMGIQG